MLERLLALPNVPAHAIPFVGTPHYMHIASPIDGLHLRIHGTSAVDFTNLVQRMNDFVVPKMPLKNVDWMALEVLYVLRHALRSLFTRESCVFDLVSVKRSRALEKLEGLSPPPVAIRCALDPELSGFRIVCSRIATRDVFGRIVFVKCDGIRKTVLPKAQRRLQLFRGIDCELWSEYQWAPTSDEQS